MNSGAASHLGAAFCFFSILPLVPAAPVEIIAHRGGSLVAPENTCAAIRACSGLVNRVEFDVRTSADGELVLIHDATVNGTTTGFGAVSNVADLTLAELKTLDAGIKFSPAFAGERIPTLAEALRALPPGVPPLIECKAAAPEALVRALRAAPAAPGTLLYASNLDFLDAVRRLDPGIQLAFAGTGELDEAALARLRNTGISTLVWMKDAVTSALVARAHSRGLRLFVATLSSPEVEPYLKMGVDGFFIDNPRTAFAFVGGLPPSNEQLARDLVAYWSLDDGLLDPAADRAADFTGRSPLRLTGFDAASGWISGDAARFGGALRLDGIDDGALVPPGPILDFGTNAASISLWVKLTVLPSGLSADFAGIYHSTVDAYSVYLDKVQKELRFKVTDASLMAARPGIPEARLRTGVWHHVAGIYDGSAGTGIGQAAIYLDGKIVDVVSGNDYTGYGLTNVVRSGQAAALGRQGPAVNYPFAGDVDDVALWRRALSPADVRRIHGENLPLEALVSTRPAAAAESAGRQEPDVSIAPDPSLHSPLVRQLVAYWNLDDGLADPAAVSAEDAAGQARGRLAGFSLDSGWVAGAAARADGAIRFDGVDDYVRIPPADSLEIGTNALTISLWVQLETLPAGLARPFAFLYGSDLAAYMVYLDRPNNELRFTVTDSGRQSASPGIPAADLQTGVWHHVAGVFDGAAGEARIYLDGRLIDTHAGADAAPGRGLTGTVLSGQYAAIGRKGDEDDFYFPGTVDDLALWRRALAPAEIAQIHSAGLQGVPLREIPRR